jgi:ubiquinone biosynthesis protein UbiJ
MVAPITYYGGFHVANIEKLREQIDTHMTPEAPLAVALNAVAAELAGLRAGTAALVERIEALEERTA